MKKLKITEKTAKIKLSRNPYLNARVRVMKSKLIVPEDYPKLLKMTPSEVSHFLGDGEYKAQIDELAVKHDGADLIELALNANASKSYGKVMRISKGTTREVITKYLLRLDIANLKTVLRGFYSGTSEEEISQAIIPGCRISVDALLFLLKKESMDDILSDSSVLRVFPHLKSYTAPKDGITLAYIENLLDSNYYTELFAIAEALPKNASVFKTFLMNEIDLLNINTLLVMKKEGSKKEDILPMIIGAGANLKTAFIKNAASAENLEQLLDLFETTKYSREIQDGRSDALEGSLSTIKRELDKRHMRKAFLLLHSHPLSVAPVLGYVFAKEVEIRNLKMISRAKYLGLPEEFMEKNLIIA